MLCMIPWRGALDWSEHVYHLTTEFARKDNGRRACMVPNKQANHCMNPKRVQPLELTAVCCCPIRSDHVQAGGYAGSDVHLRVHTEHNGHRHRPVLCDTALGQSRTIATAPRPTSDQTVNHMVHRHSAGTALVLVPRRRVHQYRYVLVHAHNPLGPLSLDHHSSSSCTRAWMVHTRPVLVVV